MNNPPFAHGLDHRRPSPAGLTRRRGGREKFSPQKPRNPLKSLDSDERIQGNPRESKAHKRGSSRRNGQVPRKPKRGRDSPIVAALGERGAARLATAPPARGAAP